MKTVAFSRGWSSRDWHKQKTDKPLFPEILWSQPQNKQLAGKLLIVGGNYRSFKAPAEAFAAALKAGIGSARVLLPSALQKTVGKLFPEAGFAPSTPSGSFARTSLAQILDSTEWADAVVLAGDFGKNSETAILLESFIKKYDGPVCLAGDSLDYFQKSGDSILSRTNTLVVAEISQLQKLAAGQGLIKHSMDLSQLVGSLTELSAETKAFFAAVHAGQIIVAANGQVSTTPSQNHDFIKIAAYMATFWLHNSEKPFEALSSAVFELE